MFGVLLRLAVVLALGTIIAVGAYFGLPRAYRNLVEPAQVNTTRIAALETELELARTDTRSLREQSGDRLAELEAALAEQGESLATVQAQLEAALEASIDQDEAVEAMNGQIRAVRSALSDLTDQVDAALSDPGEPEQDLRQDLMINRAMLHLVRARLGLLENNAGLAAEEAGRARDLLVETDADGEVKSVQDAIARIDLALEAMQTTPLVAGDDLEIAWKLLVEGDVTNE
jgi:DNA-binding FrmR family transcriptional regulator